MDIETRTDFENLDFGDKIIAITSTGCIVPVTFTPKGHFDPTDKMDFYDEEDLESITRVIAYIPIKRPIKKSSGSDQKRGKTVPVPRAKVSSFFGL